MTIDELLSPCTIALAMSEDQFFEACYGVDQEELRSRIRGMEYHDYLKTFYWKRIASIVKNRARNKCQVCASSYMLQGHHRDYLFKGSEHRNMIEVTCLCGECHQLYHDAEKQKREDAASAKRKPTATRSAKLSKRALRKARKRRMRKAKEIARLNAMGNVSTESAYHMNEGRIFRKKPRFMDYQEYLKTDAGKNPLDPP
jgi:hypothetical protein